ncbi:hypothetical protein [Neptuniibacter caesariensis]|uniref:Phosphoribosyl transferase n=1 Tax=Neptuniibacter caesariensis TaxID=207954 RepID=A0A7U8GTU2_NEPCE|nr:hypothetical protein [Neptuniibacter caesariensis]EAR62801.1 hypothetical protein MED92_06776 [Oceanospirillum sp. MED92] [Neptuniibacter caesariensis]
MAGVLKGIIFSVEDVLVNEGQINEEVFGEVHKLINFVKAKGITPVVFTNRSWTSSFTKEDGTKGSVPLYDRLKELWGDFTYLCSADDQNVPYKPKSAATEYVLNKMGWDSTEVVYIGCSVNDMRTAVNGGLLFLRATWYDNKTDYGFEFDSPWDIARFIDVFCLREHFWCHEIKSDGFEYYALAPFSTYKPEYTMYSKDARAAAKDGQGHPEFWLRALFTSIYFTGLHKRIDYITTYPGHKAGSNDSLMAEAMTIFGKCFRKAYLPDLIIRHKDAVKSQTAKQLGLVADYKNQLNTIHLNKNPSNSNGTQYKNCPVKKGKTVLLIDDFCTRGHSLEAARAYLKQSEADVIMVTWLKTVNTDYTALDLETKFDPFIENTFEKQNTGEVYDYNDHLIDHFAPGELNQKFSDFINWKWPD